MFFLYCKKPHKYAVLFLRYTNDTKKYKIAHPKRTLDRIEIPHRCEYKYGVTRQQCDQAMRYGKGMSSG